MPTPQTRNCDLFAVVSVREYAGAVAWYERLLGEPPAFIAHPTEAVWEFDDHRYLAVEEEPEHAGHTQLTVFLPDLDAFVDAAAARGVAPARRETYENGVRKVTYTDPDGSEIGFGGAPVDGAAAEASADP
ncbi:VOC family protein [Georgenia deserti]|uniref:VOC family protein n=1 Tax=Georgenia deserti TaxID=2093781 RepID=A0ABW4L4B2_9MICO